MRRLIFGCVATWLAAAVVPVLAAVGTLLSFFHQGSLGGLYGVLRGRPFAFREGFFIWPSTFFLFILSAIATGPSFLMLVVGVVETVTGRRLVAISRSGRRSYSRRSCSLDCCRRFS